MLLDREKKLSYNLSIPSIKKMKLSATSTNGQAKASV